MTTTKIAKTLVRRGVEIDLPGAPRSLSPLTFNQGLDVGEIGFATDTGRLFIGHDPSQGQPNYRRIEFPYRNIEILTENSTTTLRRLCSGFLREVTNAAMYEANLAPSTGFAEVKHNLGHLGQTPIGSTTASTVVPFRFAGTHLMGSLDYYLYDLDTTPLRSGRLSILSEPTELHARFTDAALTSQTYDATAATLGLPPIEFRFARGGSSANPYFSFHYLSRFDTPVLLYFSVVRPMG